MKGIGIDSSITRKFKNRVLEYVFRRDKIV